MVTNIKPTNTDQPAKQIVRRSRLLDYLPSVYGEDPLMARFLLIFEDILDPIENTVCNLPLYFDPLITPEPILPWLASWLDLSLDPTWPLERRRELVKSAAELYRWRGTRRGLVEFLRIYTGRISQIIEYVPGMILDEKNRLGVNTVLGSSGTGHHFTVIVESSGLEYVSRGTIRNIIDLQKPAHTVYTLEMR
jgi:phage tail-like protein